jgi:TRAP-type C4-dicarboxylate transport system permease small subunit
LPDIARRRAILGGHRGIRLVQGGADQHASGSAQSRTRSRPAGGGIGCGPTMRRTAVVRPGARFRRGKAMTQPMRRMFGLIRKTLDALYFTGGVIAAGFLIAILVIIVLQMLARWTGQVFPGATDYAGYCMAGASFFAFAYALNHGAHIRVTLVLSALGKYRYWGELWCFGIGAIIATWFARYAVKGTYWSWKLKELSQGLDATPIWIPQLSMAAGTILLAVAFWDHLIRLIFTGRHGITTDLVDQSHAE